MKFKPGDKVLIFFKRSLSSSQLEGTICTIQCAFPGDEHDNMPSYNLIEETRSGGIWEDELVSISDLSDLEILLYTKF